MSSTKGLIDLADSTSWASLEMKKNPWWPMICHPKNMMGNENIM